MIERIKLNIHAEAVVSAIMNPYSTNSKTFYYHLENVFAPIEKISPRWAYLEDKEYSQQMKRELYVTLCTMQGLPVSILYYCCLAPTKIFKRRLINLFDSSDSIHILHETE